MSDYVSSDEPITASAARNVLREARHVATLEVVLDEAGTTAPVHAVMVSEDDQHIYLYLDRPS